MRRRARRDIAALEQQLDARGVDHGTPLSRVLAAAVAPGTRRELAGLDAARSAFLATEPASRPTTLPAATRIAAGRLLVLKAIAAVGGVTLIGGVAYAASDAGLLGGSSPRPPAHSENSSSAPGSDTDGGAQTSVYPQLPGGPSHHAHPSRAATPGKGRGHGVGATASAHGSASAHATPPDTHPRGTPSSRPTTVRPSTSTGPSGHARTTPPQRPPKPAPTHPTHPAPTQGP